jgi:hypothetical protein
MGCLTFLFAVVGWALTTIVVVLGLLYELGKRLEQDKDREFDREHPEAKASSKPEARLKRIVADMFPDEWEPEYSPPWLAPLRIDAAVPARKLAFEYNGEQHYEFVEHWHTTPDGFARQQERDRRKAALLAQHGWTLIVVPHTEQESLGEGYLRSKLREANVVLDSSPVQAQPQDIERCWFLRWGDSDAGPYTEDDLLRLMRRGELVGTMWVRPASGGRWRRLREAAMQDHSTYPESQSEN